MIVTIDGPAAAGKSTAAKALAERIGFDYLDTGAMYRAVTLAALRQEVPLEREDALEKLVARIDIQQRGGRILLGDEEVSEAIRGIEVTRGTAQIADSPAVRQRMVELQRRAAQGVNIVAEGRDQGTVVFPHAGSKVFLTARPEVRAERRRRELAQRGIRRTLAEVLAEQNARDQRDAQRSIAPMKPAPNAIQLDSSDLTFQQVVDRLSQLVQEAQRS